MCEDTSTAGLWDSPARDGTTASTPSAPAVLSSLGAAAVETCTPELGSENRRSAASTSSGGGGRKPLPSPRSTLIANTPPARALTRQRSGATGAGHGVSTCPESSPLGREATVSPVPPSDDPKSRMKSAGSNPIASATSMNSTTSSRLSPLSYLATNDCGRSSRAATSCCLRLASIRLFFT